MKSIDGGEPKLEKEYADAVAAWAGYNRAMGKKTIVVLSTPGVAITSPWDKEVDAMLVNFYAGERMAQALTNILYGDTNPSGKLPMTFPKEENEQQFTR